MQQSQRVTIPDAAFLSRLGALHFNDELAIFDIHAFRYSKRVVRFPYALIAFIDHGCGDLRMNDIDYHVDANDQLLILPQTDALIT